MDWKKIMRENFKMKVAITLAKLIATLACLMAGGLMLVLIYAFNLCIDHNIVTIGILFYTPTFLAVYVTIEGIRAFWEL